jgi:transposase
VAAGLEPGGEPLSAEQWAELIGGWFPQLSDPAVRASTWPLIAPHHDRIKDWLDADVTVATIAQRLRDEHDVAASESSVRRWVATHFADDVARQKVTVPRGAVDPGSEAQIDYGKLGMWFDPATAKRVAVWAFVMVLACSRHLFVRPVIRMNQTTWCACHVAAFEFFGGVPARLVCDNLKTGVDKPDLYDPQINRSYAELATHYDTLIDPARAKKPKDKPRVERPMPYVRDSFWKGREFTTLGQMQADAVRWSSEVAGLRHSRALEGAQPLRVFEAVEARALIALPPRAFEFTTWSIGAVGVDAHLKVGKALYSVPWRLIGQRLHARSAGDVVQIFAGAEVVATHVRRPSGRSTDFTHYPPEKIAFHMKTPAWCRRTAAQIGPGCEAVIAEFMRDNAIHHLRSAQGVLGLRDKHGCARLEAACARAIEVGDPSYRTIKGILIAGTEHGADPTPTGSADAAGAFLRGPEQFGTETGIIA